MHLRKILIILLTFVLVNQSSQANIFQISSLENLYIQLAKIPPEYQAYNLVVFDLDDTLIKEGDINYEALTPTTLEFFKKIKDLGCIVIGLTARYSIYQDRTLSQLNELEFEFHQLIAFESLNKLKDFTPFNPLAHPYCEKSSFLTESKLLSSESISISLPEINENSKHIHEEILRSHKNYIIYDPCEISEESKKKQEKFEFTLFPDQDKFGKRTILCPLAYQQGVFFTSSMNKGLVLKYFLRKTRLNFNTIFFVDNCRTNVSEMDKAFKDEDENLYSVWLSNDEES